MILLETKQKRHTLQAVLITENSAVVTGTLKLSLVFNTELTTAVKEGDKTIKNLVLFVHCNPVNVKGEKISKTNLTQGDKVAAAMRLN